MPSSRLLLQLKPLNQRVRHPQRHPQRRQHRPIPRNTSRLRFPTSAHLETASPSTIIGNGNTSSAACADGGETPTVSSPRGDTCAFPQMSSRPLMVDAGFPPIGCHAWAWHVFSMPLRRCPPSRKLGQPDVRSPSSPRRRSGYAATRRRRHATPGLGRGSISFRWPARAERCATSWRRSIGTVCAAAAVTGLTPEPWSCAWSGCRS